MNRKDGPHTSNEKLSEKFALLRVFIKLKTDVNTNFFCSSQKCNKSLPKRHVYLRVKKNNTSKISSIRTLWFAIKAHNNTVHCGDVTACRESHQSLSSC